MDEDDWIMLGEEKKIAPPHPKPLGVIRVQILKKGEETTSVYQTPKRVPTKNGSLPARSLKVRTKPDGSIIDAVLEDAKSGLCVNVDRFGKIAYVSLFKEIVTGPFSIELSEKLKSYLNELKSLLNEAGMKTATIISTHSELPLLKNDALLTEPLPVRTGRQITFETIEKVECTQTKEIESLIRPPEVPIAAIGSTKFEEPVILYKNTVVGSLVMRFTPEVTEAFCLKRGAQFKLAWDGSIVFTPQKTKEYSVKLFNAGKTLSVILPIAFIPSKMNPDMRFRWNILATNKIELLEVCRGKERKGDVKIRDNSRHNPSRFLTLDEETVRRLELAVGMRATWSVVGRSYQLELTERERYFANVLCHTSSPNARFTILPKAFVSGKVCDRDAFGFSTNEKGQLIATPSEAKAQVAVALMPSIRGAYNPVRQYTKSYE